MLLRFFSKISVLILSVIFLMSSSMNEALAQSLAKPVLGDWFALGSGCRAKHDLPGNVQAEILSQNPAVPNQFGVRFTLDSFEVRGDTADKSKKQFARECAVRLNVNPPPGKIIKNVEAWTSLQVAKDQGAQLQIVSELKLGTTSLGRKVIDLGAQERHLKTHHDIRIGSTKSVKDVKPRLQCGDPKIIGFDYSWIVNRIDEALTSLSVELAAEKSLVIMATLEDC